MFVWEYVQLHASILFRNHIIGPTQSKLNIQRAYYNLYLRKENKIVAMILGGF